MNANNMGNDCKDNNAENIDNNDQSGNKNMTKLKEVQSNKYY